VFAKSDELVPCYQQRLFFGNAVAAPVANLAMCFKDYDPSDKYNMQFILATYGTANPRINDDYKNYNLKGNKTLKVES